MEVERRTEKHEIARNSLPESLRPVFDDFVADYRFAATKHHGAPFVSYIVLAEMVRTGWRLTAEPRNRRVGHVESLLYQAFSGDLTTISGSRHARCV
jgi:hypothetical protein